MNSKVAALALAALIAAAGFWLLTGSDSDSVPSVVVAPIDDQNDGEVNVEKPGPDTPVSVANTGAGSNGDTERTDVSTESGAQFEQGVTGVLTDVAGNPIEGAKVFLMEGPGADLMTQMMLAQNGVIMPPVAITNSDANGEFTLGLRKPMPTKTYEVRVTHGQFADTTVPSIKLTERNWYDAGRILMPKGLTVHGHVTVDGAKNLPIPNARVYAEPLQGLAGLNPVPGRERGIMVETDANGYYRFENIKPGLVTISAVAQNFAKIQKANNPIDGKKDHQIDFELPVGKSISGIVTDSEGIPIARANVKAVAISSKTPITEETTTHADGQFEVLGLIEGPYQITASAQGFVKADVKPVPAGQADQHIVLEHQCKTRLRVLTKQGRRVVPYQVSLKRFFEGQEQFGNVPTSPVQHVTRRDLDGSGVFTMGGIDPGSYVFEIIAKGHAKTYSKPFTVSVGDETPLVVVEMLHGGRLRGVVLSQSGEALAGVSVTTLPNYLDENPLTAMFGSMIPSKITRTSTTTNPDGEYEFNKLTPGTYQLKFSHPGHTEVSLKDLEVAEADVTDVAPERLLRGSEVAGTVIIDGRATAHVKITVSSVPDPSAKSSKSFSAEALSDAQGQFKLNKRLPPGHYSARAARQTLGSPMLQVLDFAKTQREFSLAPGQSSFTLNFSFQSTGNIGR